MTALVPSFDQALSFARDLIRIPSLSGAEGDVAARVLTEMRNLRFDDVWVDELGNVIGVVRGVAHGPTVLLNSHLDVVSEGDPEEWEYPPFAGDVADGFLHGRGAMDIKGPLAIQTHAAAALRGKAPGDVVVAHTVLEERGGLGMEGLLDEGSITADVVILGEATRGDICIGHRGRAELQVVLHGRAGHASAPERARNALDLLPRALDAVQDLAAQQGADSVLGPATIAATDVETSPSSHNVIPDRVTLTLDWRTLPGATSDRLVAEARAAILRRLGEAPDDDRVEVRVTTEPQRTYTGIVRNRDMFTPGFLLDREHPVARAASEAVGSRDGKGPAVVRPWTFATDGGWTCGIHGIPTVGFAPGEEGFAHTNRERLDLAEAEWVYTRHADLILAVMRAC